MASKKKTTTTTKTTATAKKAAKTAKAAKAAKPAKEQVPASARVSRKDTIIELISQKDGATLAAIMEATQWQAHSVRGMISTLQSKGGLTIASGKNDAGERTYTLDGAPKPKAAKPAKTAKPAAAAKTPKKAKASKRGIGEQDAVAILDAKLEAAAQ